MEETSQNGKVEIDPGTVVSLLSDGNAVVKGIGCGVAFGTYTTPEPYQIEFELDPATVTCTGEEPLVKLLKKLENIETWRFENGYWVLALVNRSELVFQDGSQ